MGQTQETDFGGGYFKIVDQRFAVGGEFASQLIFNALLFFKESILLIDLDRTFQK